ncbi:MAG: hypothetical protein HC802_15160, partial [Caldilineaceae bacterium]|nr:hypothetical protein [Caldilineaceae bacterium]
MAENSEPIDNDGLTPDGSNGGSTNGSSGGLDGQNGFGANGLGVDGLGANAGNIRPISIEDEMRASYLDYAMSVIVARALPDARDGLKPV